MSETYWHLSKCNLFGKLQPDEIRSLESAATIRKCKRSETVYLPQDAAENVLLQATGRTKICHMTPDGKQSILMFIEPTEIFGELSLLGQEFREEYTEATESSEVIVIPRATLLNMMETHPQLLLEVSRLIGERRKRVEKRLRNLLFHSNRERLIFLLVELLEQYGQQEDDGVVLKIKLSHQEMANIIGSTRETVTVVLGDLQKEGVLEIARRRVRILDMNKLAAEVNSKAIHLPMDDTLNTPNQITTGV